MTRPMLAAAGALGAIAALAIAYFLSISVRVFLVERASFRPQRRAVARPDSPELQPMMDVQLTSRDGTRLSAWYLPSRNRAAVLLLHGTGGDRAAMVPDARILARAGFGVLLLDLPGYGESEGVPTWEGAMRDAVSAGIDLLASRPDVDPQRLGVLGFSMGAYIAAQSASSDARLRATVLEATPTDAIEQTLYEYRRWGPIAQRPALWAVALSGFDARALRPIDVVAKISPRPVLIVGGTADATVPAQMARDLFAAAAEPKELWLIEGARHGDFPEAGGAEYEQRITGFFRRSLL